jgi:predicted nucleotidyltransferase
MSKEQIKQAIREAIEVDPNKADILSVSLFGSYAYGNPKPDSDVDILVEFDPKSCVGFFKFFDIKDNFEKHLEKNVDLLTPEQLSKYFRDKVLQKAEKIYERK